MGFMTICQSQKNRTTGFLACLPKAQQCLSQQGYIGFRLGEDSFDHGFGSLFTHGSMLIDGFIIHAKQMHFRLIGIRNHSCMKDIRCPRTLVI